MTQDSKWFRAKGVCEGADSKYQGNVQSEEHAEPVQPEKTSWKKWVWGPEEVGGQPKAGGETALQLLRRDKLKREELCVLFSWSVNL